MRMVFSNIKENKDGSATVTVDYDKEVKDLIKKKYNRKRVTTKLVQDFVLEGLTNYFEGTKK